MVISFLSLTVSAYVFVHTNWRQGVFDSYRNKSDSHANDPYAALWSVTKYHVLLSLTQQHDFKETLVAKDNPEGPIQINTLLLT